MYQACQTICANFFYKSKKRFQDPQLADQLDRPHPSDWLREYKWFKLYMYLSGNHKVLRANYPNITYFHIKQLKALIIVVWTCTAIHSYIVVRGFKVVAGLLTPDVYAAIH